MGDSPLAGGKKTRIGTSLPDTDVNLTKASGTMAMVRGAGAVAIDPLINIAALK